MEADDITRLLDAAGAATPRPFLRRLSTYSGLAARAPRRPSCCVGCSRSSAPYDPRCTIGATLVLLAKIELDRGATESASRLLEDARAPFRGLPRGHWRVRETARLTESVGSTEGP
ncbi:MAG: hypothetical protein MJB57_03380 [Gemmatimonadetes bacterium]|nr:hypothetical protein [Gemmatimonadota bacterium]